MVEELGKHLQLLFDKCGNHNLIKNRHRNEIDFLQHAEPCNLFQFSV